MKTDIFHENARGKPVTGRVANSGDRVYGLWQQRRRSASLAHSLSSAKHPL